MQEGVQNYNSKEFAELIESHGIDLSITLGTIKMSILKNDIDLALDILLLMIEKATFNKDSIEKVKSIVIAEIKNFLDDPMAIALDLAKKHVYKDHPYSKNYLGTIESINNITRDDIVDFYKNYISADNAILAIVGDLNGILIDQLVQSKFDKLNKQNIKDLDLTIKYNVTNSIIEYPIVRDQTTLLYAGLSSKRLDKDFNKLLIYDQIFTGGLLGSMSSKLFDLRERSGLFYTIGGSLVYNSNQANGLILIKTIVSNDRLKEAELAIEDLINNGYKDIKNSDIKEAIAAIINAMINNYSSNSQICKLFIAKHRLNLPLDYPDNIENELNKINKNDIIQTVKSYLNTENMLKIKVGRFF
jgi:predicted Zn-dependent peptidase